MSTQTTDALTTDDYRLMAVKQTNLLSEIIARLITSELRDQENLFIENVRATARKAREAESARTPFLEALARLDREIETAIGQTGEYQRIIDSERGGMRVSAYRAYREYADEVDRLNGERAQVERDLGDADKAYQDALNDAENALDGMLDWGEAMKNPFTSTRGQGTESYEQWRVPFLWSVLMLHDPKHPEWERACQWLDTLCAVSGHRPDFSKADADKARRYWDNFRDEHQPSEPAKGMGDVIAELHAPFVDRALHVEADATPPRIEDHRPRAELKIPWRLHGGNT